MHRNLEPVRRAAKRRSRTVARTRTQPVRDRGRGGPFGLSADRARGETRDPGNGARREPLFTGRRLGLINPTLYDRLAGRHGGSGIPDITLGDNTFTVLDDKGAPEFTVPGFKAVKGYDMASGLGSVDATPFTTQLAKRSRASF